MWHVGVPLLQGPPWNVACVASELAAREAESQKEKRFLRGKIEAQDARIRVLLSNTARGRAMLYWTSMK